MREHNPNWNTYFCNRRTGHTAVSSLNCSFHALAFSTPCCPMIQMYLQHHPLVQTVALSALQTVPESALLVVSTPNPQAVLALPQTHRHSLALLSHSLATMVVLSINHLNHLHIVPLPVSLDYSSQSFVVVERPSSPLSSDGQD